MFSKKKWSELSANEFNKKLKKVKLNNGRYSYGIEVQDDKKNNYIFLSPFSDYTEILNKKSISYLSKKKNLCFKFISPKIIKNPNIALDGYVHRLYFKNYNQWKNNIADYRFKRYLKENYKVGIEIKIENSNKILSDFYYLFKKQRFLKFSKLSQPKTFFYKIYQSYISKNDGFIISAFIKKKLVSSIIFILDREKKIAFYKYVCNDRKYKVKTSNILISESIKKLYKLKINKICFGFSSLSSKGLIKFKESIGCNRYYRYIYRDKNYFLEKEKYSLNKKIKNCNFTNLKKYQHEYYKLL